MHYIMQSTCCNYMDLLIKEKLQIHNPGHRLNIMEEEIARMLLSIILNNEWFREEELQDDI